MINFVCYPKCTTCKKAENWLKEKGLEYTVRDIKEDNPTYEELKLWYERSGLPLKRFFNTSGMLYRSMGIKDKLKDMSGMLVKRPIAVTDSKVVVGFKEAEWSDLI